MDQTEITVCSYNGTELFKYKSKHVPNRDDKIEYMDKATRTHVRGRVHYIMWTMNAYNNGVHQIRVYLAPKP